MRKIRSASFLVLALIMLSFMAQGCGNKEGEINMDNLKGTWKLVGFKSERKPDQKMPDCAKQITIEFTDTKVGAVSGEDSYKLHFRRGTNPCPDKVKQFMEDYETEWVAQPSAKRLFIQRFTTPMEHFSGSFKVPELTKDKLVLEILKHTFTFKKVK